ncbi:TPA: glycosyltransferase family 2 protein [Streptococcus suis]
MSNSLISIVVPIYNVEAYLDYCVNSLVNQTYRNIEILLINDGSTDKSGEMAESWARKDDRIKVYHKKNGGLSDSRNFGVTKATSNWIMFIDSDDYYEPFAVEYFMKIQKKYDSDMVVSALKSVSNHQTTSRIITESDIEKAYTLTSKQAIEAMFYTKYTNASACGKLFKKELVEQSPYPKDKLFEDLATTYKQMHYAKNISVAPISVYGYFKREGSIIQSNFDKRYLFAFEIMDSIYRFVNEEYPDSESLRKAVRARDVYVTLQVGNTMLKSKMFSELIEIQKRLSKYKFEFLANPKINIKNKVKYLMFLYSPKLYNYLREKL